MRSLVVAALAGLALEARPARADDAGAPPSCALGATPVYVVGSTASEPFLKAIAPTLAADGLKIAYAARGSCEGVEAMVGIGGEPANRRRVTGVAKVLDGLTNALACTVPVNTTADVGVSDVFAPTCGGVATTPVDVGDFFGPNLVMTFSVPGASTERAISAEAAHFVFGAGSTGGMRVDPWSDPALYFVRNAASGTQQLIGRAIRLNASRFWGIDRGGSDAVLKGLAALGDAAATGGPEARARASRAIGLLVASDVDPNRDRVRALAFQAFGQIAAYFPDSSPTAKDKRNVREGRYTLWGPLHFFVRIDPPTGRITNPRASSVVGPFTSASPPRELLNAEIDAATVPACAMRVQRASEMGPLALRTQAGNCSCYFDQRVTGASPCRPCQTDADCTTPSRRSCNFGYCEEK